MRALAFLLTIAGAFAIGGAFGLSHAPRRLAHQQPAGESTSPPAPNVEASARPSAQPSAKTATPAPLYRFIYVPTPSSIVTPFPGPRAPKILEIDLNDQTLVTPGDLRVRVLTSPDVSTVIARTWGYELAIPRVEQGTFAAQYTVPQVPAFLSGRSFDVDFVASVPDGRNSIVTLQLGLK
jgi:hypothetical protein